MTEQPSGDSTGDTAGDRPDDATPGDGQDREDGQDQGSEGADLARTALGRARAAAARKGLRPGRLPSGRAFGDDRRPEGLRRGDPAARSGAWPDARDPQSLDATLGRFVGERGWQEPVAVGGAFGRWDAVVGAELAGHCTPESLKDGTLVVRAESTAWATQVRLLTSHLVRRLDEELGHGVVTKVVVRGPQSPSWRKGNRSAPGGRGPRDTYG